MSARRTLTYEEMLERLMRLDRDEIAIRMRLEFPPGDRRWYLWSGRLQVTCTIGGGWAPSADGSTPQEAVINTWNDLMQEFQNPDRFLVRYNCASNVPIPGDEPQVWVRWDNQQDDWVDVPPTPEMLSHHRIPADRIKLYQREIRR